MPTNKKTTPASATEAAQLSNNNYFIILGLITLLVLGVGVFAAKIFISDIRHSSKVLTSDNIANRQLDSDLSAAPLLIASYNTLSAQSMVTLKDAMPATSDFPGLISLLESAGNQDGILFSAISPSLTNDASAPTPDSTTTGSYQTLDASASFSGTYPSLVKLITSLEQSARPITIDSIDMSGSSTSISGTLNITTYYEDKASLPFTTGNIK
jgi:Tfp pilus assembly protein PilO